jgi:hypothetical protein
VREGGICGIGIVGGTGAWGRDLSGVCGRAVCGAGIVGGTGGVQAGASTVEQHLAPPCERFAALPQGEGLVEGLGSGL